MSAVEMQAPSSLEPDAKRRKIEPKIKNTLSYCDHWAVQDGICCLCRSVMDKRHGQAFSYIANGLRLSQDAVDALKRHRSEICFREKKLHLVLDLDHTLIHTRRVSQLTDAEKYLTEEADSRDDLWRINRGASYDILIKLRPFVHDFLREANELFSMYVYTMGGPEYAETVLKLLDPLKIYFGNRMITRRDSRWMKTLDLVLAEERHVVIVDDSWEAWPDHRSNLLEIKRYDYFKQRGSDNLDSKSYSEEKTDESAKDGALANVLKFLEEVHRGFFTNGLEDRFESRDVRPLMLLLRP